MNDLTRYDLGLSRREAARLLAAVAAGPALLEPLERWLRSPLRRPVAEGHGTLNVEELEHLEAAAYVFRQWDDTVGGGLRRKAVVGQLGEVCEILHGPLAADLRARLLSTAARLAETAAIMSWDSGLQGAAQRYYTLGFRAAHEAGDRSFAAYTLAGTARQLVCLGGACDALELTRIALRIAPGRDIPGLQALLLLRQAWAYAAQGRVVRFEATVDQAREAFEDAQAGQTPPWLGHFDHAEFVGTVGGRYLELARRDSSLAGSAIEWTTQAIAARPAGRLRSNALDHLGLTESWIIAGDLDQAATAGHWAADAAQQTRSDRVTVQIEDLLARADRADPVDRADRIDHSPLADLRDRLLSLSR
ncbi:MAG: hypothetical protein ACFCUP_18575 [Actinomycetales bacterium]